MTETLTTHAMMLGQFFGYWVAGFVLVVLFMVIYTAVTPVNEIQLIRQGNVSAAVNLSGSVLGFILPLASIIAYSVALPDMLFWGAVALVVQLLVHFLIRLFMRDWAEAIKNDRVSVAIVCACLAAAAGLINAACMVF